MCEFSSFKEFPSSKSSFFKNKILLMVLFCYLLISVECAVMSHLSFLILVICAFSVFHPISLAEINQLCWSTWEIILDSLLFLYCFSVSLNSALTFMISFVLLTSFLFCCCCRLGFCGGTEVISLRPVFFQRRYWCLKTSPYVRLEEDPKYVVFSLSVSTTF